MAGNKQSTSSKQSKLSSFFPLPFAPPSKESPNNLPSCGTRRRSFLSTTTINTQTKKGGKRKSPFKSCLDDQSRSSGFQQCILCYKFFPKHNLLQHAARCNGDVVDKEETIGKSPSKDETSVVSNAYTSCDIPIQMCESIRVKTQEEVIPKKAKGEASTRCHAKSRISNGDDNGDQKPSHVSSSSSWTSIFPKIIAPPPTRKDPKTGRNLLLPTSEPIPGLFLFENFISEEEEKEIIHYLDNQTQWKHATFNGKHLGQRWGVHCNLRDRRVYPQETELPSFVTDWIIPKLQRLHCMKECIPNEANAIDYYRRKGHYLKSHVDDRQLSKESIANLSLAGDCNMTFRLERKNKNVTRYGKNYQDLPNEIKVFLPRRTLQVLTKCARYDYSHGIRNNDLLSDRRISITMRQSPLTTSQRETTFKKKMKKNV